MILLANSPGRPDYRPQPPHCDENLSEEKTYAAFQSNLFENLDHLNYSLYEVELVKAQIEHTEPKFISICLLEKAKLQKLELYYNFSIIFFGLNMIEELEKDTSSLNLAHAEKKLEDCIRPEMTRQGSACA